MMINDPGYNDFAFQIMADLMPSIIHLMLWSAWYWACLVAFAACALTDLRSRRIPNVVTYPFLGIAFIVAMRNENLASALLAAGLAASLFLLPRLIAGGSAVGWGDIKLAVMGAMICGLPFTLAALLIAFGSALLVLIPLLLSGRVHLRQTVPFGPFLAVGFVPVIGYLLFNAIPPLR